MSTDGRFLVFRVDVGLSEQTSIQCLLHWRFTLNDNGIIRGNGTWGAEEDERLRKLAPVFSSPSTGPRYVLQKFLAAFKRIRALEPGNRVHALAQQ